MGIYLAGVFIAFIINLIIIVNVSFTLISTKNRNIKQIGLHFNPWAGNYTKEKLTWKAFSLYIAYLLIISPLFSWLSVGWSVFIYLKGIINKVPVPEKIKEINFKLSSVDLPKEKVKEYMNEFAKFYGGTDVNLDDRTLNDTDEDDPDLYVLEPIENEDDWYREITLNRKTKNYTIYFHSPDYDAQFTDVYEYKFIGMDLRVRVIADKSEFIGSREEWNIKDNVVLELEVRNRMAKNNYYTSKEIEKKIADLKELVEWRECNENKIKYFIMFRHSDLFTEFELRKYMRSELERIDYGYKILEDEINRLGGVIIKQSLSLGGKPFKTIKCNDSLSEEEQVKVHSILEEKYIKNFGISYYEFEEVDSIRQELEKYLAKLS